MTSDPALAPKLLILGGSGQVGQACQTAARQRGYDFVAPARADRFPLLPYAADALRVGEGDLVRAVPLSPRDR